MAYLKTKSKKISKDETCKYLNDTRKDLNMQRSCSEQIKKTEKLLNSGNCLQSLIIQFAIFKKIFSSIEPKTNYYADVWHLLLIATASFRTFSSL